MASEITGHEMALIKAASKACSKETRYGSISEDILKEFTSIAKRKNFRWSIQRKSVGLDETAKAIYIDRFINDKESGTVCLVYIVFAQNNKKPINDWGFRAIIIHLVIKQGDLVVDEFVSVKPEVQMYLEPGNLVLDLLEIPHPNFDEAAESLQAQELYRGRTAIPYFPGQKSYDLAYEDAGIPNDKKLVPMIKDLEYMQPSIVLHYKREWIADLTEYRHKKEEEEFYKTHERSSRSDDGDARRGNCKIRRGIHPHRIKR